MQNDFSFEKRDWMKVEPEELPNGSQLVSGQNLGSLNEHKMSKSDVIVLMFNL